MDTDYIKITIQHENHYIIGKLTNDLLIQRVLRSGIVEGKLKSYICLKSYILTFISHSFGG